jgi:hypothetical protein
MNAGDIVEKFLEQSAGSEPILAIEREELHRLYQEANQAGLEGRVITNVTFVFDGDGGAISAHRVDWTPAPREHVHRDDCNCPMCLK